MSDEEVTEKEPESPAIGCACILILLLLSPFLFAIGFVLFNLFIIYFKVVMAAIGIFVVSMLL